MNVREFAKKCRNFLWFYVKGNQFKIRGGG